MSQENIHTIERAYKTRIYLNDEQEYFFYQHAGNRRYLYNQLLGYLQDKWDKKVVVIKRYGKNRVPLAIPVHQEVSVRSKTYLQVLSTEVSNRKENAFLKKTNSQSNQEAVHALASAISKWKSPKFKNFDKPNFKNKNSQKSFVLQSRKAANVFKYKKGKKKSATLKITHLKSFLNSNCKHLSKRQIEEYSSIKLKGHFPYDQNFHIKKITFSQDKIGRFFVSMAYEKEAPEKNSIIQKKPTTKLSLIGCDLGMKSKLTSSDGATYNTDLPYTNILKRKADLQIKVSKKVERKKVEIVKNRDNPSIPIKQYRKLLKTRKRDKYTEKDNDRLLWKVIRKDNSFSKDEWKLIYGSNFTHRLQKQAAKFDVKAANIRKYQNHVLSKEIVDNNDIICLEDLNISGMKKLWGRKISDLALSQLKDFICYKAENQGKIAYQIDRFYPSSKTCCMCQNKNKGLSLDDRDWTCSACGQTHDRDINASINIFVQGIKEMNEDGVDILEQMQRKELLHSFWNDVSAKMFYDSETPNALHALLGLEDVVDGYCSGSPELKDAPVIACA